MTLRHPRILAISSALGLALVALAPPAAAADDTDGPEPPERTSPERSQPPVDLPPPSTRVNLALTGVGVTAGFYGGAVLASLMWMDGPWAPELRIPIAGPWMAMHDFKCNGEHPCGTPLVIARGVLAGLDGIGQIGGLAIALESLFLPVQQPARTGSRPRAQQAWVRPVPILGRDTIGLGIIGQL